MFSKHEESVPPRLTKHRVLRYCRWNRAEVGLCFPSEKRSGLPAARASPGEMSHSHHTLEQHQEVYLRIALNVHKHRYSNGAEK